MPSKRTNEESNEVINPYSTLSASLESQELESQEVQNILEQPIMRARGRFHSYDRKNIVGNSVFEVCSKSYRNKDEDLYVAEYIWKHFSYFRHQQVELIPLIANRLQVTQFAGGDNLMAEGDHGDCLYAIYTGKTSIWKDGKLIVELGEGDVVGQTALAN